MLSMKSKVLKAIIYAVADPNNSDQVREVQVLMMKGPKVKSVHIFGNYVDPGNEQGLIEDIINEETDSRFVNSEKTKFTAKYIAGDNVLFIEEVFDVIKDIADDEDLDYILYNDDTPDTSGDFYNELMDYIADRDDDLTPTHFKDVFSTSRPLISDILQRYGVTDHMFSKESPLSCAIYTGLLFDMSLGK